MKSSHRKSRHRPPAGVVSIELLLLMPFFALLIFSTYFLGDLMFVQEKTELAARYVAWKRQPVSKDQVWSTFFGGLSGRKMVPDIEVIQESSDRRYPQVGEGSADVALASPPRFVFTPLASEAHAAQAQQTAYIAFEGNTGAGNKASHQSYFGTDQPADRGGGGWITEQHGAVVTEYRPMGYAGLNLKLASGHRVLMGREYHTEIVSGSWWTSTFRFREVAVVPPLDAGIAATHDDVKGTSWENSGLMKELYPQP